MAKATAIAKILTNCTGSPFTCTFHKKFRIPDRFFMIILSKNLLIRMDKQVTKAKFSENTLRDLREISRKKMRMRQIRGVKGEAVVVYCEPLTTKKMTYYRLSRRAN
jgi:hypothetical protein